MLKKKFTSIILLGAILASIPLNSQILCIESNGTSSIETAPLGVCSSTELSLNNVDLKTNQNNAADHEECIDCTDLSLSPTKSVKLQNDYNYSTIPDTFLIASTSFEIPVFTEPIVSFTPNLEPAPNQLHKHLQTIIFLI